MKWQIKSTLSADIAAADRLDAIIDTVFGQRHLPDTDLDVRSLLTCLPDLDQKQLQKAVVIIKKAIKDQKPIIIYGDYDCDGVCATALLWETLHAQGAKVMPFIPHRIDHGYGLSQKGITACLNLFPDSLNLKPLIITVDNGIRAHEIAKNLKKQGIDLIITDHHIVETLPEAAAIVHSTQICGAGVAWVLASQFIDQPATDLVALATICDQMPLLGVNRLLVKSGLKHLQNPSRVGLKALYRVAQINEPSSIDTYHLGFIIGPRINAAGRLGHAIEALRLLCTQNAAAAATYAEALNAQNLTRQELTADYVKQALLFFKNTDPLPNLLFYESENAPEGILGLIAGRLTEHFARPSVVLSTGSDLIKGSARSLNNLDITSLLSQSGDHLLDFGGHTLAAGLTTTVEKIKSLKDSLLNLSADFDQSLLEKYLEVELELIGSDLNFDLVNSLENYSPFGLANPQPIFCATFDRCQSKIVGQNQKHLKMTLFCGNQPFSAIGFNLASRLKELSFEKPLQFAFTVEKNTYLGKTTLQLNLKDFREC